MMARDYLRIRFTSAMQDHHFRGVDDHPKEAGWRVDDVSPVLKITKGLRIRAIPSV